jgi:hypothetical protein
MDIGATGRERHEPEERIEQRSQRGCSWWRGSHSENQSVGCENQAQGVQIYRTGNRRLNSPQSSKVRVFSVSPEHHTLRAIFSRIVQFPPSSRRLLQLQFTQQPQFPPWPL